ncbi:DUF7260 family protein [Halorussus amylolyticus]
MPVTTHIDQARERVDAERVAVAAKLDGFDAFIDRLEALSPVPVRSVSTNMTATAGTLAGHTASTEDRCRPVRTAFAETIRSHSVADMDESESLLKTIEAEFSPSIAVALAPSNETAFSPELKRTVISAATARRAETEVLLEALDHEATQLDCARDFSSRGGVDSGNETEERGRGVPDWESCSLDSLQGFVIQPAAVLFVVGLGAPVLDPGKRSGVATTVFK